VNLGPGISKTALPKDFYSSGINCGVRKYRPDVGVIISERLATCAAVVTQNELKAAPIQFVMENLPASNIKAIITNSGQANACTGPQGIKDNLEMVGTLAKFLGCEANQVMPASTGVIGVPMEIEKIKTCIPQLVNRLGQTAESFATAILTTDLVPKTVTTVVKLSSGEVRITGISKGSGMIHPNMATMLGYLLTDIKISEEMATKLLKKSVDKSFNMISVDGDTSTNDCVFLMANGATEVELANANDEMIFLKALTDVSIILAKSIVSDGEGATKTIECHLKGLPEKELGIKAARGLTLSPLVKTAIHGEDPNWGRIIARLGAEKVPADLLEKMSLKIGEISIYAQGAPVTYDSSKLQHILKSEFVKIDIDFFSGDFEATAWGCDLSKKYVEINAEYTT